MTRIGLAAAALSILLTVGVSAIAQGSQLTESVKNGLSQLGYDSSLVDSLSGEQISEIENVLNTGHDREDSQAEKKRRIDVILNR